MKPLIQKLKSRLRPLIESILPYPYHFYIQTSQRASYVNRKSRHDIVRFEIADQAYLEVYWKVFGIGRGPAIALYIDEEEILKFDCYGSGKGHYHIQSFLPQAPRHTLLHLPEVTVEAQIDRALFELDRNLPWYLERHPLNHVRDLKVNKANLKQVLAQAKTLMLDYTNRVPQEPQTHQSVVVSQTESE